MLKWIKYGFIAAAFALITWLPFSIWLKDQKIETLEAQLSRATGQVTMLNNQLNSKKGKKEGYIEKKEPCVPVIHYVKPHVGHQSEGTAPSLSENQVADPEHLFPSEVVLPMDGSTGHNQFGHEEDSPQYPLLLGQFHVPPAQWGGVVTSRLDSQGANLLEWEASDKSFFGAPLDLFAGVDLGLDQFGSFYGIGLEFRPIRLGSIYLDLKAGLRSYKNLSDAVPESMRSEFSSVFGASVSLQYRFNLHGKP